MEYLENATAKPHIMKAYFHLFIDGMANEARVFIHFEIFWLLLRFCVTVATEVDQFPLLEVRSWNTNACLC